MPSKDKHKNPYLRRAEAQSRGFAGRQSEKRLAKRMGGKAVPGSGAGRVKGDIRKDDFLIEAKSTTKLSISLKWEWLEKISKEAQMTGSNPALAVTFTNGQGRPIRCGDWVAVPRWLWEDLFSEDS